MSNRNKGNIRKFPEKTDKLALLKKEINGVADDLVSTFSEMVSAKMDALNWAIDQLPKMLAEAGLPEMRFEPSEGLYPFLLSGFSDVIDEDNDDTDSVFQGLYPCFTADDELPAGVEQYILLLVVNADDESDEEASHRIDALLGRVMNDGATSIFDGEAWVGVDDMLEFEDDDDEDDGPFY